MLAQLGPPPQFPITRRTLSLPSGMTECDHDALPLAKSVGCQIGTFEASTSNERLTTYGNRPDIGSIATRSGRLQGRFLRRHLPDRATPPGGPRLVSADPHLEPVPYLTRRGFLAAGSDPASSPYRFRSGPPACWLVGVLPRHVVAASSTGKHATAGRPPQSLWAGGLLDAGRVCPARDGFTARARCTPALWATRPSLPLGATAPFMCCPPIVTGLRPVQPRSPRRPVLG